MGRKKTLKRNEGEIKGQRNAKRMRVQKTKKGSTWNRKRERGRMMRAKRWVGSAESTRYEKKGGRREKKGGADDETWRHDGEVL